MAGALFRDVSPASSLHPRDGDLELREDARGWAVTLGHPSIDSSPRPHGPILSGPPGAWPGSGSEWTQQGSSHRDVPASRERCLG